MHVSIWDIRFLASSVAARLTEIVSRWHEAGKFADAAIKSAAGGIVLALHRLAQWPLFWRRSDKGPNGPFSVENAGTEPRWHAANRNLECGSLCANATWHACRPAHFVRQPMKLGS
jgi:hypothetical protein